MKDNETMIVFSDTTIPIFAWAQNVDENTVEQAINLAEHPKTFHHIALMPDCHVGYGMPIGGVIAVIEAVIPNAVGVDIGCGMVACRVNNLKRSDLTREKIREILNEVRKNVPVGFKKFKYPQEWYLIDDEDIKQLPVIQKYKVDALRSLGTLGGGNHFIELQYDVDTEDVWMMIHSGSRMLGKKICDHYNKIAVEMCDAWASKLPSNDLAFLPEGSYHFTKYLREMNFALDFAYENRRRMLLQFKYAICEVMGEIHFDQDINIHHNYANIEHHYGKNVWVHRKGATAARKDQLGIIPGSMGTSSYIVRGLGNPRSFESCSHGAGRVMSRTAASETLTKEACDKAMEGIVYPRWDKIYRGRLKGHLDLGEAPQAYKNIDIVIKNQRDLVEPIVKLKPLGVVKG